YLIIIKTLYDFLGQKSYRATAPARLIFPHRLQADARLPAEIRRAGARPPIAGLGKVLKNRHKRGAQDERNSKHWPSSEELPDRDHCRGRRKRHRMVCFLYFRKLGHNLVG